MKIIKQFLHPNELPDEQRQNYTNFLWDIAWFGVLSGSTQNFLNIYATRIGASEVQIGILAAVTAVISLLFTMPASRWLEGRNIKEATFWTSIYYRIWFLAFVPLPWLFSQQQQVWALIIISFVMAIPLTGLAVGFGSLFAESVPANYRAYFAGSRNVMLSVAFMASSLLCGGLLTWIPFPYNYQLVFFIGFVGGMLSSYFLSKITLLPKEPPTTVPTIATRPGLRAYLRMDIWRTSFSVVLVLLFLFHIAQYSAIPLFPIYFVRELNLSDNDLGIGTALFYLAMLIGSAQLHHLVARLGNKGIIGLGVVGMAIYPILLAQSSTNLHYFGISFLGGYAWSYVGGTTMNYIFDHSPADDRPAYLAWYNLMLNAAVLIGSLSGPFLSNVFDIRIALVAFGLMRLLVGLAILRWGNAGAVA